MANLLFLLLASVSLSVDIYPGAKSYISKSSLNQLAMTYFPYIADVMSSGKIPVEDITVNFMLTKMHFSFYNTSSTPFTITPDQVSVSLDSKSSKIYLTLSNLSFNITTDFKLKWFGNYEGTCSLMLLGTTFQLPITLDEKQQQVELSLASLKITSSKMIFKMKSNNVVLSALGLLEYIWPLYRIDEYLITKSISHISSNLNPKITQFFSDLSYMAKIGDSQVGLDYQFLSLGPSSDSSIEAGIVGKFLVPAKKYALPPYWMNTTIPWVGTSDFRNQFTDYFFNTMLWALTTASYLEVILSKDTTPGIASYLTTSSLEYLIPGLTETYGQDKAVIFNYYTGNYPVVSITPGDFSVTGYGVLSTLVQTNPVNYDNAFILSFNISSQIVPTLITNTTGTFLSLEVDLQTMQFTNFVVSNSKIGNLNSQTVDNALNWAVQSLLNYIYPDLGTFVFRIPLPEYMTLDDTQLNINTRAIELLGYPVFNFE